MAEEYGIESVRRSFSEYDGFVVYDEFSQTPVEDIQSFLNGESEEISFVAVEDVTIVQDGEEERYMPGDYFRGVPDMVNGRAVAMQGDILNSELDFISRDQRNDGGFMFVNGNRATMNPANYSNVEIKARFPDELRQYPETVHTHNVPEWYFAVGEFDMWVANEEFPTDPYEHQEIVEGLNGDDPNEMVQIHPEYFDVQNVTDEAFRVDPGMYHGIKSKSDDGYLVIARGDPTGQEPWVGKWDLVGNQFYDHFDEEPEFPELVSYDGRRI